tara:strand:+ start:367 stop:1665 length:1299 start_codon:yes stop_codon:yes gene_type:complete
MLGFSIAFAIPFSLFAIFPKWLESLPQSGGWLNSVKIVLGFLELALAIKFLSMPDQASHWGILPRDIFLVIWILIFFSMGLYLFGIIKFAHDSGKIKFGIGRIVAILINFSLVGYMLMGLYGFKIPLLAGIIPPEIYSKAIVQYENYNNGCEIPPSTFHLSDKGDIFYHSFNSFNRFEIPIENGKILNYRQDHTSSSDFKIKLEDDSTKIVGVSTNSSISPSCGTLISLTLKGDDSKILKANLFDGLEDISDNFKYSNAIPDFCSDPNIKHADKLHLPYSIPGYYSYEDAIECAIAQNKPVFIDFTGHACFNCRKMEEVVWSDPEVLNILKNDYVVVALYVDDRTKLEKSDWYTDHEGRVRKTIGKKNFFIQYDKFKANAQPYYVILDPFEADLEQNKGDIIKPLVVPRGYDTNIEGFVKFLNEGKNKFYNK